VGGWEAEVDASSGKMYFWNEATGETSWDPPPGFVPPAAPSDSEGSAVALTPQPQALADELFDAVAATPGALNDDDAPVPIAVLDSAAGTLNTVDVALSATVGALKTLVAAGGASPRLAFGGSILEDGHTLQHYGIQAHAQVLVHTEKPPAKRAPPPPPSAEEQAATLARLAAEAAAEEAVRERAVEREARERAEAAAAAAAAEAAEARVELQQLRAAAAAAEKVLQARKEAADAASTNRAAEGS